MVYNGMGSDSDLVEHIEEAYGQKTPSTRENELRGQHWPFLHHAFALFRQPDDRRLLTDSLMRSTCVVELDVLGQC